MTSVRRREAARAARFVVLGAANSIASIVVYVLLARVLPIAPAYTLAYLCGIAMNALLSGRFVFGVRGTRAQRGVALLGFSAVFCVGLVLVSVLEAAGLPSALACLGSVCVTAPANYAVGRAIYAGPASAEPDGRGVHEGVERA